MPEKLGDISKHMLVQQIQMEILQTKKRKWQMIATITTYFQEEISTGISNLSMGTSTSTFWDKLIQDNL